MNFVKIINFFYFYQFRFNNLKYNRNLGKFRIRLRIIRKKFWRLLEWNFKFR